MNPTVMWALIVVCFGVILIALSCVNLAPILDLFERRENDE